MVDGDRWRGVDELRDGSECAVGGQAAEMWRPITRCAHASDADRAVCQCSLALADIG